MALLNESLNTVEEALNETKMEEGAFLNGAKTVVNNIRDKGIVRGVGASIADGINAAANASNQKAQQQQANTTQGKIDAVHDLPSMATACIAVLNDASKNQNINWKDI